MGEDIDGEQAIEAARVFSERENLNFQVISETKGSIPSYTVVAIDGEERVIVEVSQKGGMVLWMTVASAVQDNRAGTLTLEEIIKQGWGFWKKGAYVLTHYGCSNLAKQGNLDLCSHAGRGLALWRAPEGASKCS